MKSSNLGEKDGKSDKRQKLLDWLKKSQAKRDENNRQVFSRWIEKMDNLKAQERDRGSNLTFYCDHLPPPHILYSAINNFQSDAIGNPTVYVGVSQFVYPPHQELIDPQFMPSTHSFLKGSNQFTELHPTSCKEYFFQNDHRPIHNPCCYPHAFTLESVRQNESGVEATEEMVSYAPRATDQSMTFISPGTTACCQSMLSSSMMSYSTPTQMMLPVPCIQYCASDSDGANTVPPNGDGINGAIPLVDTKFQSFPMVVGFDHQFCKWIQSTSRHLTPVSPQYPFLPHSDRPTNGTLHTPCNNTGLTSAGSDPRLAYNPQKSPLNFEFNQWNSLLDDINTKAAQPQEPEEKTTYKEVNQSNDDTGKNFQFSEAEGGSFVQETFRDG
ncbi:unnamed protein product [Mesocestoides corti]|uniref:Expressed conserved protein n=1 Tax=Mesocestoides corti TaxID=53468 RepID=A0A0R3U3D2_MESCO|nr:unnamed protein product [Mesocestoides corti]